MNELAKLFERVNKLERLAERVGAREEMEVAVNYYTATAQNIPDSAYTVVNFDTSAFDPDSLVATGTAWAFSAPIGGVYAISAMVTFTATTGWADAEVGAIAPFINGTAQPRLDWKQSYGATASVNMCLSGCALLSLAQNDAVDVRVYQSSGGTLALFNNALFNHVQIWKI